MNRECELNLAWTYAAAFYEIEPLRASVQTTDK